MNAPRTAYLNTRVVDPSADRDEVGGLLVEEGRILDAGRAVSADTVGGDIATIDCGGRTLIPGLVDTQVYAREPGAEHQETFATAGAAAAAGGVTAFATMPNTDPVIDNVALVEYVRRLADDIGGVRIHPFAAATKGLRGTEMTELGLLQAAGAVGFTDGGQAITEARFMRRLLAYAAAHDALIWQHPEEPTLTADGDMNDGETATRLGLIGIPRAAEVIMVERDIRLLELTGGRYHVGPLSTAQSVEAVRRAKVDGLTITASTAPHYLALNELAVGDYRTFAKTAPPLRSETDRRAVVAGLADGTIDIIASGHCPQDAESKRLPFAQAAAGVVGLETLLPIALELHHNQSVLLATIVAALTIKPARLLKLPFGTLGRGSAADFALVDLDVAWQIDAEQLRSKSKNSAFDGKPVQGRVWRTYVDGRCLFDRDAEQMAS